MSADVPDVDVADVDVPDVDVAEVRAAFERATYTVAAVDELLGPAANGALSRFEVVPAERVTRGGSPLETLVRLFILGLPVPYSQASQSLPVAPPFVERDGDEVRPLLTVRPYEKSWWVVSDRDGHFFRDDLRHPRSSDEVLGITPWSVSLAQLTAPQTCRSALDLGTGCGVQSLHLAQHAASVTVSDVNPRAVRLARLTAALSGVDAEFVQGNLFEPFAGRRFDLVVSFPPLAVSPFRRFLHSDSGLGADEMSRRVVGRAPVHLTDGGWCHVLADWVHIRRQSWEERLTNWVRPTGCDAWVIQREVLDPAEYVRQWLYFSYHDDPRAYMRMFGEWLEAFERDGVEAVGRGWVTLRASRVTDPVIRMEHWPYAASQPAGHWVGAWFARQDWLRRQGHGDAALLTTRLVLAGDVACELTGAPPASGSAACLFLRQQRGMGRRMQADAVVSCLVAGCNGAFPVRALLDAIAPVVGRAPGELHREYLPVIRSLVADGFLVPAGPTVPPGEPQAAGAAP